MGKLLINLGFIRKKNSKKINYYVLINLGYQLEKYTTIFNTQGKNSNNYFLYYYNIYIYFLNIWKYKKLKIQFFENQLSLFLMLNIYLSNLI